MLYYIIYTIIYYIKLDLYAYLAFSFYPGYEFYKLQPLISISEAFPVLFWLVVIQAWPGIRLFSTTL